MISDLQTLLSTRQMRQAIHREVPSLHWSTIGRLAKGEFHPRYKTQQAISALFEVRQQVQHSFAVGMRVKHKLCGTGVISELSGIESPYEYRQAYVRFDGRYSKWGWVLLSCLEPLEEVKIETQL